MSFQENPRGIMPDSNYVENQDKKCILMQEGCLPSIQLSSLLGLNVTSNLMYDNDIRQLKLN